MDFVFVAPLFHWQTVVKSGTPDGMSLTTDRNDPDLKVTEPSGMQKKYLVLSEDERQKGFIRPYRESYIHVKPVSNHPLRDLTPEEHERYDRFGYLKYEEYPEGSKAREGGGIGRYWTAAQLRACGCRTTMGRAIAETYARKPDFYGATFCVSCQAHFPVAEFLWEDGSVLGS